MLGDPNCATQASRGLSTIRIHKTVEKNFFDYESCADQGELCQQSYPNSAGSLYAIGFEHGRVELKRLGPWCSSVVLRRLALLLQRRPDGY